MLGPFSQQHGEHFTGIQRNLADGKAGAGHLICINSTDLDIFVMFTKADRTSLGAMSNA